MVKLLSASQDELVVPPSEQVEGGNSAESEKKKGIVVVWDVAFDWLAGQSTQPDPRSCPLTCRNHPKDLLGQIAISHLVCYDPTPHICFRPCDGTRQGESPRVEKY